MVHPSRFEREASAFGGQRSIQLSYGCLWAIYSGDFALAIKELVRLSFGQITRDGEPSQAIVIRPRFGLRGDLRLRGPNFRLQGHGLKTNYHRGHGRDPVEDSPRPRLHRSM